MQGWPQAGRGQRVGLLGGSFDPAHEGHAHITRVAMRRFALDRVWWLVSPGNPLKEVGPAPMADRLMRAKDLMQHPRVQVTDVETQLKTRYTAQTLQRLMTRYPGVHFVWLMGADNLSQFHRWQDWRWIMDHVPIGVLARPGDRLAAGFSPAARIYRGARVPSRASAAVGLTAPPAWCFINLPLSKQSSTALRNAGTWRKRDTAAIDPASLA